MSTPMFPGSGSSGEIMDEIRRIYAESTLASERNTRIESLRAVKNLMLAVQEAQEIEHYKANPRLHGGPVFAENKDAIKYLCMEPLEGEAAAVAKAIGRSIFPRTKLEVQIHSLKELNNDQNFPWALFCDEWNEALKEGPLVLRLQHFRGSLQGTGPGEDFEHWYWPLSNLDRCLNYNSYTEQITLEEKSGAEERTEPQSIPPNRDAVFQNNDIVEFHIAPGYCKMIAHTVHWNPPTFEEGKLKESMYTALRLGTEIDEIFGISKEYPHILLRIVLTELPYRIGPSELFDQYKYGSEQLTHYWGPILAILEDKFAQHDPNKNVQLVYRWKYGRAYGKASEEVLLSGNSTRENEDQDSWPKPANISKVYTKSEEDRINYDRLWHVKASPRLAKWIRRICQISDVPVDPKQACKDCSDITT